MADGKPIEGAESLYALGAELRAALAKTATQPTVEFALLKQQVEQIDQMVKRIYAVVIEGNGRLPLTHRVNVLEENEEERCEQLREARVTKRTMVASLVASLTAVGIALFHFVTR